MRLLSLDLERFGPFTARRLAFRPDARLHVVLGPNEAGKSSALAAVTDLLFGIDERTPHDFLHRKTELRLGAEIVDRTGRHLAFWRRKGRRQVLSGEGGAALPDDVLAPFLGAISRDVFCNAFGLNAKSLREGAAEMLKADGDLGATLLAAASGLRGFRDAARTLEAEAEEIWKPSGRLPVLNRLIGEFEAARKDASSNRLGADQWKRLLADEAEAREALAAIDERRRLLATEESRLLRLRATLPVIARIDRLLADETAFADLPDADDATVADLSRAVKEAETGRDRLAAAEAALAAAERALDTTPLDPAIEPLADRIERLVEGLADFRKSETDVPRVEGEAAEAERDLARLALRLGFPDWTAAEAALPTDMARASLKTLLAEGRALDRDRVALARDLAAARQERAALAAAAEAGRAPLVDPAPLRSLYDTLAPALAAAGRRDELSREAEEEEAAIAVASARLRPPLAAAVALATLPVPAPDVARRAGETLEAARIAAARAAEALAAARRTHANAERRVAARIGSETAVEPARLLEARRARDAAWAAVRDAAFRLPGAVEGAALAERVAAVERESAAADDLADRIAAGAEAVAALVAETRTRDDLAREVAEAEAVAADADRTCEVAEVAWAGLWRPAGISPLGPGEMAEWRAGFAELSRRAALLGARRRDIAALSATVDAVREPLLALAGRLGLGGFETVPTRLLGERVAESVKAAERTWTEAREGAMRRDAAAAAAAALVRKVADTDETASRFDARWRDALAEARLPVALGLDAGEAALTAWAEIGPPLEKRQNRRSRVAGMQRRMDAYQAAVADLATALGLPPSADRVAAVRVLQERAGKARDARVLRREREAKRDEAIRAVAEAREAFGRAEARVAALALRIGRAGEGDVAGLATRLAGRAAHRATLRAAREELARAGAGADEADLRSEAAGTGPDDVEGRLAGSKEERGRLDGQSNEAFARHRDLAAERVRLEGGTGAEKAAARKGATELAIRETARRWAVLRLGSLLLDAATERHRAGRQDPLMRRAGDLFGILTGGAYAGIEQSYDDGDRVVIAGRRGTGETVALDGLSEGTKDQLYLGLRLAYLEDYARRAEPAPFLGDDIFASFDDARTIHGLQALAAIGRDVQTILFTHHESVARAAEAALGAAADIVPLA